MEVTRTIQIEVTMVIKDVETMETAEEQRECIARTIKNNIFHDADQVNVTVKDFVAKGR